MTLKLMTAAAVLAASSACAVAMTVSSHVDRDLNFTQYRTYDWGPADALPTGDPRLDRDPFFKDQVQGAVERQLASRGLELSSTGAPDLLIHYHANITERIDVGRADREYGACPTGDCPDVWYEAGTLVIDFMDARTNQLVWRGWAQNSVEDMLRDRDKMADTIDQAVTRMLKQLPRTQ
jgi:hypothetical protein